MVKLLNKINNTILETINLGEQYFYTKFAANLESELKAACFIIKAQNPGQFKIYPDNHNIQLSLLDPFNATNLLNSPAVKSLIKLDKLLITKIQGDSLLKQENFGKRLVIKAIKSVTDKRHITAVMILQKRIDEDFSSRELQLVEYYKDMLAMANSLLDYEQKVNNLTKTNSSLSKLLTVNFPNIDKFPVNDYQLIDGSYLVLDIRKSSELNEYLKKQGGSQILTHFYKKFRNLCEEIAVTENGAWFRKQIGDRLDFAWQGNDHYANSVKVAIQIYESLETVRRELSIPFIIPIGIGVAKGKFEADYQVGEIKGDAPRIATELQEKHKGIFLAQEPDNNLKKVISIKGYVVLERKIIVRNKLLNAWVIRKEKIHEYDIQKEDTYEQLHFANRIYADSHLHIEGVNTYTFDFLEKLNKSIMVFNRDPKLKDQLEGITNKRLSSIVNSYLNSLYTYKEERFSFQEFLTKLYCTKIVLASKPHFAKIFIKETLNDYFNKFVSVRLGITPSLTVDFPHLDRKAWNNAVYDGISDSLSENPTRNLTLVIETKRQHLNMRTNNRFIYENNLQFLHDLYIRRHKNINFSLSLCDDAALYPLFNHKRAVHFEAYLNVLKAFPNVSLSLHMLEDLPHQDAVDVDKVIRVVENPVLELEYALEVLNRKNIQGVTFVHMSNLFSRANPNVEYRNAVDDAKIEKGARLLKQLVKRNDKIVVCYSSNICLRNTFLLDYPEVIELLLTGKINIVVGTDDPGAFRVGDIGSELNKISDRIKNNWKYGMRISGEYYTGNELATLAKFVLARNSWRHWHKEKSAWLDQDINEISRKYGYDAGIFSQMMHYDICPDISCIADKKIRKEVFRRERELVVNF